MFAATRLGTSLGEYYYRYMWVVAEGCSFFCTGWSLVWLMGREILIESTVIGFFFQSGGECCSKTNVHPSIAGKEKRFGDFTIHTASGEIYISPLVGLQGIIW